MKMHALVTGSETVQRAFARPSTVSTASCRIKPFGFRRLFVPAETAKEEYMKTVVGMQRPQP